MANKLQQRFPMIRSREQIFEERGSRSSRISPGRWGEDDDELIPASGMRIPGAFPMGRRLRTKGAC